MPLPALNWKYVGARTFLSSASNGSTIASAHNALAALGALTQYPDGTVRTPGSGSAWTWNARTNAGITEAVTGVPPAATNPFNFTYIIAGTAATAPTAGARAAPDAGASEVNTILAGMNRNTTGAYTTWNSATPFTNAGFTGYWYAANYYTNSLNFPYMVQLYESQEACIVLYRNYVNGVSAVIMGAWLDPLEYVNGTTCETDGRIYALSTSGGGLGLDSNTVPATWLTTNNASTGMIGAHSATARQPHCGYIPPGATPNTSTLSSNAAFRFGTFPLAASNVYGPSVLSGSRDGSPVVVPLSLVNVATGAFIGQMRQIGMIPDQPAGTAVMDGTTIEGWAFSSSTQSSATYNAFTGDTILLKA